MSGQTSAADIYNKLDIKLILRERENCMHRAECRAMAQVAGARVSNCGEGGVRAGLSYNNVGVRVFVSVHYGRALDAWRRVTRTQSAT